MAPDHHTLTRCVEVYPDHADLDRPPSSPFIEQYVVDLASMMVQQGNPAKGRPSPTALSYEHWSTSSRSRSRCSSSPDARPWKRQWI